MTRKRDAENWSEFDEYMFQQFLKDAEREGLDPTQAAIQALHDVENWLSLDSCDVDINAHDYDEIHDRGEQLGADRGGADRRGLS